MLAYVYRGVGNGSGAAIKSTGDLHPRHGVVGNGPRGVEHARNVDGERHRREWCAGPVYSDEHVDE
jgi:hypothetical protein